MILIFSTNRSLFILNYYNDYKEISFSFMKKFLDIVVTCNNNNDDSKRRINCGCAEEAKCFYVCIWNESVISSKDIGI